jgi:Uncharacterized protein conserved in bacteria (DUF2252)
MHDFAAMRNLDLWYSRFKADKLARDFRSHATGEERKRLDKGLAKARAKDSLRAFSKLTRVVDGKPRIVSDPPLIVPVEELVEGVEVEELLERFQLLIRAYRSTLPRDRRKLIERYRFVDAARKVVGVGSVGTRAWIVLMRGRDDEDPLFLQAKEAQASVLESFLGESELSNHGERVVEGQRLMQAASDIMLGWLRSPGIDGVERDFYVRQLWDAKGSASVETMVPNAMTAYAELCGATLAKAHARSGDAVAIAAYLGSGDNCDKALDTFAESYADQNERDYDALSRAVTEGRITAEAGL